MSFVEHGAHLQMEPPSLFCKKDILNTFHVILREALLWHFSKQMDLKFRFCCGQRIEKNRCYHSFDWSMTFPTFVLSKILSADAAIKPV